MPVRATALVMLFFIWQFTSCHHMVDISTEETVCFTLPSWPPVGNVNSQVGNSTSPVGNTVTYPPLSRWLINASSPTQTYTFFTSDQHVTFTLQKNEPFCLTAKPITVLTNGSETSYFKDAGVIYPYADKNADNTVSIKWKQGFLAANMQKIIASKTETGVSDEHLSSFLNSFNWKKAQETIDKSDKNPWLIDSSRLLDNLCYGNFKSTFLNTTGCYQFGIKTLFPDNELEILSSYIPENTKIIEGGEITLKKGGENFLSDGSFLGARITVYSAKKVSVEYIYMPIFIEDI